MIFDIIDYANNVARANPDCPVPQVSLWTGSQVPINMAGRLAALFAALLATGCSPAQQASTRAPGPLRVLVTISTFQSFARGVGGDRIAVSSLVPVGASPEDYQPAPADIERLHAADVLIENGIGLESWLARTIDNAKNPSLDIVTATRGLPVKDGNPHLWMDPELARGYVRTIRDALDARDPAGKGTYDRNAAAYDAKLRALEREIAGRIATIPPDSRSMIVFHNAWQYYDDRFGLRTVGVLELSPGQEPNPQYIAKLIEVAKASRVRAVFAEPEYSPKLVQALAQSAGIATIESLYDDSIGSDPRVQTYEDMLRYDTATIVRALGGKAT
jgi:ABC-type Zn uptake system ZnuABC Zn-binding protein ZnuA